MLVREATIADMGSVCKIYNALIPTTTVSWADAVQGLSERIEWFETQTQRSFPVLVAESEGQVVGFASYGSFRGDGKWPGYRFTVEHTVHVHQAHWGDGVGRRLVEALIGRATAAGMHVMVGGIDADNAASIAFHERLGFCEVARMPQVGRKFDRWLDLVLVQLILE